MLTNIDALYHLSMIVLLYILNLLDGRKYKIYNKTISFIIFFLMFSASFLLFCMQTPPGLNLHNLNLIIINWLIY